MEKQHSKSELSATYTLSPPIVRSANKYHIAFPHHEGPPYHGSSTSRLSPGAHGMDSDGYRQTIPVDAFLVFCSMHRDQLKQDLPRLDHREQTAKLGELWHEMTERNKMYYFAEAKRGQLERSIRYQDCDYEVRRKHADSAPSTHKFGGYVPPFSQFQPKQRKRRKEKKVPNKADYKPDPLPSSSVDDTSRQGEDVNVTDISANDENEQAVASILDPNENRYEMPTPSEPFRPSVTDGAQSILQWQQANLSNGIKYNQRAAYPTSDPKAYPTPDPKAYPTRHPRAYSASNPRAYPTRHPRAYSASNPRAYSSSDPGSYPCMYPEPETDTPSREEDSSRPAHTADTEEMSNCVLVPCDVTIAQTLGWPVNLLPRVPKSILKRFTDQMKRSTQQLLMDRMVQPDCLLDMGGDRSTQPSPPSPQLSPARLSSIHASQESPSSSTFLDSNLEPNLIDIGQEIIVSEQVEISSTSDEPSSQHGQVTHGQEQSLSIL